ncbi:amidohydrolase family protein [Anseongella ginsenosidimutans]|nr:amidohydrolase family protein [Anseongella ginsenosidimutans]
MLLPGIACLLLMAGPALSQQSTATSVEKEEWDVNSPPGPSETHTFNLEEGTWMNLDVSPDGKQIVFDLLGDIYIMPLSGGNAKLLRGGLAYEVQPRFSPDGSRISFTSDAGGADNIWVMNSDGSESRQVTKEDFRLLNNAVWTPDGNYLVARKHFTSTRSLGAGEMWMYHFSGGEGLQLTKRKNDQQDAGEPFVSPDGKFLYWSEDVSEGPFFEYNKDPNTEIYAIKRLNLATGDIEKVTGGPGGAVRPAISPDGKWLAFVKRVRSQSVLYVHDLQTGQEFPVYAPMSKDQQEAWAIFGPYCNFDWLPDNKTIVFYAKGKIRKVHIESHAAEIIPFRVSAQHSITEALHFENQVFSPRFEAKMIRQVVTSPDGKTIAFNAAGYIYTKRLPNGKPERISDGKDFEYEPAYSPDGKQLVYVTWNDSLKSAIVKIDLGTGKATRLTTEKGYYSSPAFSPDGKLIVYEKSGGNIFQGYSFGKNAGLYLMNADGGTPRKIIDHGSSPEFNVHSNRVYFLIRENGKKTYKSIDLNGGYERTHFTSGYATKFALSPDNKWVAFTELFNVYVAAFPHTGGAVDLSGKTSALPVFKLSRDAGTSLHWSGDSKKIHWVLGPEYFSRELNESFTFLPGAPEELSPPAAEGLRIGLELETDVPSGRIAFKNARIITMKGDEVIENGTLIINENKIEAVGPAENVAIPAGAKVYDAAGKTIMPGIVDVHAHLPSGADGKSTHTFWPYYVNLAFGVTTTHDPSNNTEMVFTQSEMVKSGRLTGPRIYSTGTILYGAEGDFKAVVNSLDDARSHLRRLKAIGAFSVKSYNQPRRSQRQQIVTAARELEMQVVPEGGSTFTHNMSMILDGHTGVEHNIPVSDVYQDVYQLWNASNTAYTPTLIVAYGSQSGENYWYDRTRVWENERLLNFTPRSVVDPRSIRRPRAPDEEYGHFQNSRVCKVLSDGGTKINLGAHGQLQGLGAHWELWMLAQGGMSPLEAIRCATINGAAYLGMDKEIGSLEEGKLADLLVLDKNPLEDIHNSTSISKVMLNGRLYDAATMNQTGNHEQARKPFYWEREGYANPYDWHALSHSLGQFQCAGCGLQ